MSAMPQESHTEVRLWIDDERVVPSEYNHSAQSSAQALSLLGEWQREGVPVRLVSFDHDLGETWVTDEETGSFYLREDTSRRVLTWMIEADFWPMEIRFHTANPVGRQWLLGTARRYAPGWVHVNEHDPWRDPSGMVLGL